MYLFIYLLIWILTTQGWKSPATIKHSFLGKYPYHKVIDRKHSGRQREFKSTEESVTLSDAPRRLVLLILSIWIQTQLWSWLFYLLLAYFVVKEIVTTGLSKSKGLYQSNMDKKWARESSWVWCNSFSVQIYVNFSCNCTN